MNGATGVGARSVISYVVFSKILTTYVEESYKTEIGRGGFAARIFSNRKFRDRPHAHGFRIWQGSEHVFDRFIATGTRRGAQTSAAPNHS
jgi:hypothetical protein